MLKKTIKRILKSLKEKQEQFSFWLWKKKFLRGLEKFAQTPTPPWLKKDSFWWREMDAEWQKIEREKEKTERLLKELANVKSGDPIDNLLSKYACQYLEIKKPRDDAESFTRFLRLKEIEAVQKVSERVLN